MNDEELKDIFTNDEELKKLKEALQKISRNIESLETDFPMWLNALPDDDGSKPGNRQVFAKKGTKYGYSRKHKRVSAKSH